MKQILFTVAVLFAAVATLAQTGSISRYIHSQNGEPLSNTTVSIAALNQRTTTNDEGLFNFRNLPFGEYNRRPPAWAFSRKPLLSTSWKRNRLPFRCN